MCHTVTVTDYDITPYFGHITHLKLVVLEKTQLKTQLKVSTSWEFRFRASLCQNEVLKCPMFISYVNITFKAVISRQVQYHTTVITWSQLLVDASWLAIFEKAEMKKFTKYLQNCLEVSKPPKTVWNNHTKYSVVRFIFFKNVFWYCCQSIWCWFYGLGC